MRHVRQVLAVSAAKLKAGKRYQVVDADGSEVTLTYLGSEGTELVFSSAKSPQKSKVLTATKNFELVKNALIAAGLFSFFKK